MGNAGVRNLTIFQRGEAPLATGKAIVPSGTAKGTEAEEGERVQLTAHSMGL